MSVLASLAMPTYRPLDEAAKLAGVSRRTLQNWLRTGKLTPFAIAGDRRRYVDVDQVKKLREPRPVEKSY